MSCAAAEWQEDQAMQALEAEVFDDVVDFDGMNIEFEDEDNCDDDDDTSEDATDEDKEIIDDTDNKVVMFATDAVDALLAANTEGPRDQVSRIKMLVKKLKATSNTKELAMIPENWRDYCCDLAKKFPNFEVVIHFIRDQLSLSALGDGVLRLPPLLLLGPPGIGKTEFALTIADDFKTKLEIIDISSSQTGSTLTGSEAFWGNSQPGMLFNTLTLGEKANPIILLDEIDKARGSSGYDPLAALYNLLEPRQARQFHDLSVPELTLDASHVIWMATANCMESVNSPIIDRFTVFTIDNPTPAQSRDIAANQYQRFINNHPCGGAFESTIRADVLNELGKYHPRRVRKILEQAFGEAAFNCRNYLIVDDITTCEAGEKKRDGMGFLTDI
jgi:ATP-dependent Lon protease